MQLSHDENVVLTPLMLPAISLCWRSGDAGDMFEGGIAVRLWFFCGLSLSLSLIQEGLKIVELRKMSGICSSTVALKRVYAKEGEYGMKPCR